MASRALRNAIGSGLLAALAGLGGCKSDGSPDIRITDDPLSKLAPILGPGVGHALTDRNGGAAVSDMSSAMGTQRNAEAGRTQVNVYNSPQGDYRGLPREGIEYDLVWDHSQQTYIMRWRK